MEAALCCDCGAVYPVIDAILRLLPESATEYAEFLARHGLNPARTSMAAPTDREGAPSVRIADRRSARNFHFQWTIYRNGDLTWFKDDAGLRKQEFLHNLETTAETLRGKSILDVGCGNGELTRSIAEYGVEVVAMDFSRSVEGARERLIEKSVALSHRVHYLQGDVLAPPLRSASFDLVHSSGVLHHTSSGVLHHTPSTHRAFRSVAQAPRRGGKLYVQLYRRRGDWFHFINDLLRTITTRMPMRLLYVICYTTSPLHAALSRLIHYLRREPAPPRSTARERAVQMFDNYSPRYQHRHTVPEIVALFESEGYEDIKDSAPHAGGAWPTAWRGLRLGQRLRVVVDCLSIEPDEFRRDTVRIVKRSWIGGRVVAPPGRLERGNDHRRGHLRQHPVP